MICDKGSIIVETVKIGDELIDTSEEKEICWIERRSDILEIYVYDKIDDNFFCITEKVEHCEHITTSDNCYDQASENS